MSKYDQSVLRKQDQCPRGLEHIVDLLGKGDCTTHGGRMIASCDPHQCPEAAKALGWDSTAKECSE